MTNENINKTIDDLITEIHYLETKCRKLEEENEDLKISIEVRDDFINRQTEEIKRLENKADFAAVKHGEWLHKNGEMICSVCGAEALMDEVYYESPYCPDCGAKMDGGKNVERFD